MDFGLFTTKGDGWDAWRQENVSVVDGDVTLATTDPTFVAPTRVVRDHPAGFDVVDVDQDDCGSLYLLATTGDDEQPSVYWYDHASGRLHRHLCLDLDGEAEWRPTALCVTDGTIYVAASARTEGTDGTVTRRGWVGAYSRRVRQLRWERRDPLVEPVALVAIGGQTVRAGRYSVGHTGSADGDDDCAGVDAGPTERDAECADRGADCTGRGRVTVAVLDRGPQPGTGFLAELGPGGRLTEMLTGVERAEDVTVDSERMVSVLESRQSGSFLRVRVDDADATDWRTLRVPETTAAFTLSCLDAVAPNVLVAGVRSAAAGDPTTAAGERTLYRWAVGERSLERLVGYQGGATNLRYGTAGVDRADRGLYVVDESGTVRFLAERARYRRNETTGRHEGRVVTRLDAGREGETWHRIRVDFSLDGGRTQVRVAYAATDDPNVETGSVRWQPLDVSNPADALLSDATGRYLWLSVELAGGEDVSPRLHGIRTYFPRQSYLRYLPAVYRADPESERFFERFLSLFESVFVDVETEIEHITRFFDPDGVPDAYLTWLGSWLAVAQDEAWPDEARRALIRHAPAHFRRRGTRAGLREMVRLFLRHATSGAEGEEQPDGAMAADGSRQSLVSPVNEGGEADAQTRLDPRVIVVEDADLDCIDSPENRAAYRALLRCPQCFLVLVGPGLDEAQLTVVRRIVDAETPAHAVGRTVGLRSWTVLGGHTYLGVNSALSSEGLVLSRSALGGDSVVTERESGAQLGISSTIGDDAVLT